MLSIQRALLISTTVFLTQACSGGGGDGDGGTTGGSTGGSTGGDSSNFSVSTDITSIAISKEFQKLNDSDPQAIQVTYTGELIPRLLTQTALTNSFAIDVQNVNETGESSTATVVVDIDDSHLLPPNLYTTTLGVAAGVAEGTTLDIDEENVTVSVLVAEKVNFRTVTGIDAITPQTSEIISNTSDSWTVANNADWLTSELVVDGQSVSLTNTVSSSLLNGTNSTAEITLTNTTTQQEFTIPAEVARDQAYIFSDEAAISFVLTENVDNTLANLNISDNAGGILDWTATTNVDWLELTQSEDGTVLTVEIVEDETQIVTNALSEAIITIQPTSESALGQTISLSLYHSDNEIEPEAITDSLSLSSSTVVVSPIRPHIYIADNNTINVYHQFTGGLIDTITVSNAGTTLTNFIMHPNGKMLLTQTNTTDPVRYNVNLETSTSTEITTSEINSDPVAFMLNSGHYVIVTETMEFADEDLVLLDDENNITFVPSHIGIAKDANTIFAVNEETSTINRFIINVNLAGNDKILTFLTHTSPEIEGEISDLVASSDAADIYLINENTEHVSFTGAAFVDNGLLYDESDAEAPNTNSGFITVENDGTLTGIYTPSEGDVTTHSVAINNRDEPFYLRTVAFNDNEFQTYLYQYNRADQHITSSFIDTASTRPTTPPVDFIFTSSNNHVVSINTVNDALDIKAAPFLSSLNANNITVNNRQKSTNTSTTAQLLDLDLRNISTDWTWLPPAESPWLLFTISTADPQTLNIALGPDTDNLDAGLYERDIYIYDIKNRISGRLQLELTVTE